MKRTRCSYPTSRQNQMNTALCGGCEKLWDMSEHQPLVLPCGHCSCCTCDTTQWAAGNILCNHCPSTCTCDSTQWAAGNILCNHCPSTFFEPWTPKTVHDLIQSNYNHDQLNGITSNSTLSIVVPRQIKDPSNQEDCVDHKFFKNFRCTVCNIDVCYKCSEEYHSSQSYKLLPVNNFLNSNRLASEKKKEDSKLSVIFQKKLEHISKFRAILDSEQKHIKEGSQQIEGRNLMNKKECKEKLYELAQDTKDTKEVLQKPLEYSYKINQPSKANVRDPASINFFYDHIVIMDFEVTCEEIKPPGFKHEIIEFPAVLVNIQSMKIIIEFHSYVRPILNPVLSKFCTELTGITQENVAYAPKFSEVIHQFENWLIENNLIYEGDDCRSIAIATDGPCDISHFLLNQCKDSQLPFPEWAKKWINIKKSYCNFYKTKRIVSLDKMLENLGLHFEGRRHSGIDDSTNIARIVHLLSDGCNLRLNERIQLNSDGKPDFGRKPFCSLSYRDFGHLRALTIFDKIKKEEKSNEAMENNENTEDDHIIFENPDEVDIPIKIMTKLDMN